MASSTETLDMSLFFGTSEEKQHFCKSLLDSLRKRGCIKIRNHGIPDRKIHELFAMIRQFFALPHEIKMDMKHPPKVNRGYRFVGQENVSSISGYEKGRGPGVTKDVKETVDMGSPTDALWENIWPPEGILPGFRACMESFYDLAFTTEHHLLTALAIGLGISEEYLRSLHSKAENEFRLLHYPAIPISTLADGTRTRIAEHTDFGTITMLFQDSTGGLQVEDQTEPGKFRDVESSEPTDIILNIGDSLQRLSNDTFKAACHRVTYPSSVKIRGDESKEVDT